MACSVELCFQFSIKRDKRYMNLQEYRYWRKESFSSQNTSLIAFDSNSEYTIET